MKSLNYVFALIIILTVACSKKEEHKTESKKSVDTVEIVMIQKLQPARSIALPGDLRPWQVTNIQAKVKGYVRMVTTDRGSSVKKGQVLATLEAPELKAQLAEALAKVEDYKSKQMASKLTYTRMWQTSKTQGAIALNELDVAKSKMQVDSMQVLSATASAAFFFSSLLGGSYLGTTRSTSFFGFGLFRLGGLARLTGLELDRLTGLGLVRRIGLGLDRLTGLGLDRLLDCLLDL